MQYETGKQTSNNDDIKLRSEIASINFIGDFISDPISYYDCKWRIESIVKTANDTKHRKNLYTYHVFFSDDTKTVTVNKQHWQKPGDIVLCTVKPIPDE